VRIPYRSGLYAELLGGESGENDKITGFRGYIRRKMIVLMRTGDREKAKISTPTARRAHPRKHRGTGARSGHHWICGTHFDYGIGVNTLPLNRSIMIDRFQAHMQAMQMLARAQEVTANNMANLNTPGFKTDTLFNRLLTEELNGRMVTSPVAMQQTSFQQGVLESTANPFDLAIDGKGFFVVESEGQTYLTRNGRFSLDSDGFLRDEKGSSVMGNGGPIQLTQLMAATNNNQGDLRMDIAKDGTIRINDEVIDRLQIVKVDDMSQLERRGNNYFAAGEATATDDDDKSYVMQGYFEKSNVETLTEMVTMMQNMRMFESQQKAMRTTDEILAQVTTRLGQF
jgi:flagellar basal-body rod protein FlgF